MTGSGTATDPYIITTAADLQAIESSLAAYYELGGDVDASATSGWNGNAGFAPITTFTGQLDGKGYVISDLFIDRDSSSIGLFSTNAGTVQNLGLANVNMSGTNCQIGPIAYKNTGTITRCYATGTITSNLHLAGLVEWNTGTITNSYSRVTVNGSTFAAGFVV